MRRTRLVLVGLCILASAGCVGWFMRPTPPPQVAMVDVVPREVVRTLSVTGRLRAPIVVNVRSRVAGQITELRVREGDVVAQGDILAILDSRRPRAIRDQARAALAAREAELVQARRDLARAESLRANGTGTVVALETAQTSVRRTEEDIFRLNAAIREVDAQLEEFVIRAPVAGTVSQRPIDPGQVIATDTVILRLDGEGRPWVEADVDELYASQVRVGQSVVMAEAGRIGADVVRGKVLSVAPRTEPTTGSRMVRVLPDEDTSWVPGQSIDLTIEVAAQADALVVPRSSLLDARSRPAVLVFQEGRVERRNVRPMDWPGSLVMILDGLRPGDVVVREPRGIQAGSELRRAP